MWFIGVEVLRRVHHLLKKTLDPPLRYETGGSVPLEYFLFLISPSILVMNLTCKTSLQPQALSCTALIWNKQLLDGSPQNVWTSKQNYLQDEARGQA